MTLFNGIVNQVDLKNKTVHSVSFDTYDFNLELAQVLSARKYGRKGRKEMSLVELRQSLKEAAKKNAKYYLTLMEYHKKFSIPFSCIVFVLFAFPVGLLARKSGRAVGFGIGLLMASLYWWLLFIGHTLGIRLEIPPVFAMWFPNLVVFITATVFLILRTNR